LTPILPLIPSLGEFKLEELRREVEKENKWNAYFKKNGNGLDMIKTTELKK